MHTYIHHIQFMILTGSIFELVIIKKDNGSYFVFVTGCSLNIVFVLFSRILKSLPPLPRQHSAVIGCTANRSDCTLA